MHDAPRDVLVEVYPRGKVLAGSRAQYGLSHGLSSAVCLPHVAEFNRLADAEKFAQVAEGLWAKTFAV